jgi:hypothetical protein
MERERGGEKKGEVGGGVGEKLRRDSVGGDTGGDERKNSPPVSEDPG